MHITVKSEFDKNLILYIQMDRKYASEKYLKEGLSHKYLKEEIEKEIKILRENQKEIMELPERYSLYEGEDHINLNMKTKVDAIVHIGQFKLLQTFLIKVIYNHDELHFMKECY